MEQQTATLSLQWSMQDNINTLLNFYWKPGILWYTHDQSDRHEQKINLINNSFIHALCHLTIQVSLYNNVMRELSLIVLTACMVLVLEYIVKLYYYNQYVNYSNTEMPSGLQAACQTRMLNCRLAILAIVLCI